MKKRTKVLTCLTVGVLTLAVSATAAFGSANGYSAYKKAVMGLALEEENFSAKGSVSVKVDGKVLSTTKVDYAQAGADRSTVTTTTEGKDTCTQRDTTLNGVNTWFIDESGEYWQSEMMDSSTTLLGYDKDDEMQSRLVNFLSIAADTVAGELKNNFVQVGSEQDKTLYQVSISGSQVPALVNAGLSLLACENSGGTRTGILWDDFWPVAIAYYEETTGETLSEDLKKALTDGYEEAYYEAHKAEIDKVDDVTGGVYEKYDKILEQKGGTGVLQVKEDGSYTYYATWMDYLEAQGDEGLDRLEYYAAKELNLDKVDCTFALDKKGRLTDNEITATFTATDGKGVRHTVEVTVQLGVSGYGTTTVQPLDVGKRTKAP